MKDLHDEDGFFDEGNSRIFAVHWRDSSYRLSMWMGPDVKCKCPNAAVFYTAWVDILPKPFEREYRYAIGLYELAKYNV